MVTATQQAAALAPFPRVGEGWGEGADYPGGPATLDP